MNIVSAEKILNDLKASLFEVDRLRRLVSRLQIERDIALEQLNTEKHADDENADLCLLIAKHNYECESECKARGIVGVSECYLYTTRGLKCPDCPVKNWTIRVP